MSSSAPVQVFHYWSPACKPCMHLKPLFEDLEEDFGSPTYAWTHINTQDESLRAQKMNVTQIPCMVVFKHGKEVGRHVGSDVARYYAVLRTAGKA